MSDCTDYLVQAAPKTGSKYIRSDSLCWDLKDLKELKGPKRELPSPSISVL